MITHHDTRDVEGVLLQTAEEQGETLKAEVASLSAQLRQSEEALKASQERYLRLTADFDNFRKRSVSFLSHATHCMAMQWKTYGQASMTAGT